MYYIITNYTDVRLSRQLNINTLHQARESGAVSQTNCSSPINLHFLKSNTLIAAMFRPVSDYSLMLILKSMTTAQISPL
jgi:hypothetical protein